MTALEDFSFDSSSGAKWRRKDFHASKKAVQFASGIVDNLELLLVNKPTKFRAAARSMIAQALIEFSWEEAKHVRWLRRSEK